jgi:hypothetical protein
MHVEMDDSPSPQREQHDLVELAKAVGDNRRSAPLPWLGRVGCAGYVAASLSLCIIFVLGVLLTNVIGWLILPEEIMEITIRFSFNQLQIGGPAVSIVGGMILGSLSFYGTLRHYRARSRRRRTSGDVLR